MNKSQKIIEAIKGRTDRHGDTQMVSPHGFTMEVGANADAYEGKIHINTSYRAPGYSGSRYVLPTLGVGGEGKKAKNKLTDELVAAMSKYDDEVTNIMKKYGYKGPGQS